jgi:hypothetical protein
MQVAIAAAEADAALRARELCVASARVLLFFEIRRFGPTLVQRHGFKLSMGMKTCTGLVGRRLSHSG